MFAGLTVGILETILQKTFLTHLLPIEGWRTQLICFFILFIAWRVHEAVDGALAFTIGDQYDTYKRLSAYLSAFDQNKIKLGDLVKGFEWFLFLTREKHTPARKRWFQSKLSVLNETKEKNFDLPANDIPFEERNRIYDTIDELRKRLTEEEELLAEQYWDIRTEE